jgi:hypothetical protein
VSSINIIPKVINQNCQLDDDNELEEEHEFELMLTHLFKLHNQNTTRKCNEYIKQRNKKD